MSSAVVICLAVAVAALGRIRLKNEESRLYRDLIRVESQLAELRRHNDRLETEYESMTSMRELDMRVERMHLNLKMPGEDSRVVLQEPAGPAPASTALAGPPPRPHAMPVGAPVAPGVFHRKP